MLGFQAKWTVFCSNMGLFWCSDFGNNFRHSLCSCSPVWFINWTWNISCNQLFFSIVTYSISEWNGSLNENFSPSLWNSLLLAAVPRLHVKLTTALSVVLRTNCGFAIHYSRFLEYIKAFSIKDQGNSWCGHLTSKLCGTLSSVKFYVPIHSTIDYQGWSLG